MLPREHLPLALVSVALLGILFIMYRELNSLKSTVAHLSVPPTTVTLPEETVEEESHHHHQEEEDQDKEMRIVDIQEKNPTSALKSSKKTK